MRAKTSPVWANFARMWKDYFKRHYAKSYTGRAVGRFQVWHNFFLEIGNCKYAIYTDKIYQSVFKEKAKEYKHILNLSQKDNATVIFLLKNGYMSVANIYFREMENISYYVAAGHINEELLKRILEAILNNTYDTDEELKLEIFNAISVIDEYY